MQRNHKSKPKNTFTKKKNKSAQALKKRKSSEENKKEQKKRKYRKNWKSGLKGNKYMFLNNYLKFQCNGCSNQKANSDRLDTK